MKIISNIDEYGLIPGVINRYLTMFFSHIFCGFCISTIFFIKRDEGEILVGKFSKVSNGLSNMTSTELMSSFMIVLIIAVIILVIVVLVMNNKTHIIRVEIKKEENKIKLVSKKIFSSYFTNHEFNIKNLSVVNSQSDDGVTLFSKIPCLDIYSNSDKIGSIFLSEKYWNSEDVEMLRRKINNLRHSQSSSLL